MPCVSVIVPVYNVEQYINRCLDSLVNQTLKEIEIIIVNDGSIDNSKVIIDKYLNKYDNIIYIEKENGGLSDARNFGIQKAKGEFIAFLDSDDYVELDTYELMYKKAKENNSDYVECNFIWEYKNKRVLDNGFKYKNINEMILYGRVVAWNKLIKREIIQKNNLIFPKGLRYEDVEFFYKLIMYLNKFAFIDKPLVHYVQRNTSISKIQNEKTNDIFLIFERILEFYKKNELFEKHKKELEYTYARIVMCSSLRRIVKIKNYEVRKKLEKKSFDYLNSIFPEWKKNYYLVNYKSFKNIYLKLINKFSFPIFCFIFRML